LPEKAEYIKTCNLTDELGLENYALTKYAYKLQEYDIIHDHSHAKYVYSVFRDYPDKFYYCSTSHDPGVANVPVDKPNWICVSHAHAKSHKEQSGIDARVVYNAIDPKMFKYKEEKSDRYLFISRPTPDKDPIDAVKMCKELDVPLDMVCGRVTGITKEAVTCARMCLLGSKWKWWGEISHSKKVELLSNAKALIFPIAWDKEPFGLVVVEALISGTPVVTYDRGPMKELIIHGKTGYLANTRKEFMEYMLQVDSINPKDCRRSVYDKKFIPRRMCSDYIKIYRDVLRGIKW